jgi:ankyrin repeat protein
MKQISLFVLGCIVMVSTAQSTSAQGGNISITKSISEYFKDDKLITNRQAFYNADKTQRVEYYCEDENMPGGANEGASNPANVHCEVALFLNQSGKWIFSDTVSLRYGSVKDFTGNKLIIEMLEYGDEDALCCPSESSTQVFNTESGKFVENIASKGKLLVVQAVKDGVDQKLIGELINQGNDINAKDKYGQTALMIAAENSNVDTIKLLLDHNVDINAIRNNGKTALVIAADKGSVEIVKLLLDKGANPNIETNKDRSAPYYAIQNGNSDISRLLIERGANVNTKKQDVMSALMLATNLGREDLVRLLLDNGADFNATYQGKSILVAAAEGSKCKIVRLLLDKGASTNKQQWGATVLMRAAGYSSDTDCLIALLEKGANINARNGAGHTALYQAAFAGKLENLKLLLKNGADPNVIADGQTALDVARQMKHNDVVDFLENRKPR